jgi:hypothetical protein
VVGLLAPQCSEGERHHGVAHHGRRDDKADNVISSHPFERLLEGTEEGDLQCDVQDEADQHRPNDGE